MRTKSAAAPMVLDGDGEGVMDIAGAGLLDARRLLLYAAPYEKDPKPLRELPKATSLVVTDSNRRRGVRWSGLSNNYGYTEQAGEQPLLADPSDQRLEVFPESTDASKTVTVLDGVKSVRADRYGSAFNFQPESRASQAFDDHLKSSWLVDEGVIVGPHQLVVELDQPITTDHVNLIQYFDQSGKVRPLKRFIRKVQLHFDDGHVVNRTLNQKSRDDRWPGRPLPEADVLEVRDLVRRRRRRSGPDLGRARTAWASARSGWPTRRRDRHRCRVTETQRMPETLLGTLGKRSADHPLAIVMTRDGTMDRIALNREFTVPTARDFSLTGTARLGKEADDDAIDRAFGLPNAGAGGVTATSTSRLDQPAGRASSALDGDPTTAWTSQVLELRAGLDVTLPAPTTLDHLDLQIVTDGRHSLPRVLTITDEHGQSQVVTLPPLPNRTATGTTVVPVTFGPLEGQQFTIAVTQARPLLRSALQMPVGIAELGIPGVRRAAMPTELPGACQSDLVLVDGKPFPVRISGSTVDALARKPLTMASCDPAATVALGPGRHTVRVAALAGQPDRFRRQSDRPGVGSRRRCRRARDVRGHRDDHLQASRRSTAHATDQPRAHVDEGARRCIRRPVLARARPEQQRGMEGDNGRPRPRGDRSSRTATPTGGRSRPTERAR